MPPLLKEFQENTRSIKKLYKYLFLLFFLPVITQALTIPEIIATTAKQYGIDPQLALYVSYKESQWDCNAVGDHGTSYGCWQIHNPTLKKVRPLSIKDAKDPIISTKWAMQTMKEDGNCHQWSTCPTSSLD